MDIIAIAGGSGSGKSTISYKLVDTYPDIFEVLNLDDYQKVKETKGLPMLDGMINWDHPDITRWDNVLKDIKTLQKGIPITIQTWAHRSNPDYFKHGKLIPRTISPKKILVVEGHFALLNAALRKLYKRTYFLDIDQSIRLKRREKFHNPRYDTKVLVPMHEKYIEPTKKYADVLLNIVNMSSDEVYKSIEEDIKKMKLI